MASLKKFLIIFTLFKEATFEELTTTIDKLKTLKKTQRGQAQQKLRRTSSSSTKRGLKHPGLATDSVLFNKFFEFYSFYSFYSEIISVT